MTDAFEEVLRLVAEGRLTAAEAAPILDALGDDDRDGSTSDVRADEAGQGSPGGTGSERRIPTAIRIEVTEAGRRVVNLRVPVSLGRMALDRIPGLSGANVVDLVRRAVADGRSGTLLDIDDEGDGVRIALE
jgi:hypothetical protein